MDLLIKNMDIPKSGNLTLVIHPNGDVYLGDVLEDIKIGKAIELPPHGDLVEISEVWESQRIHGQASHWDSYVPVIVEAST